MQAIAQFLVPLEPTISASLKLSLANSPGTEGVVEAQPELVMLMTRDRRPVQGLKAASTVFSSEQRVAEHACMLKRIPSHLLPRFAVARCRQHRRAAVARRGRWLDDHFRRIWVARVVDQTCA